MTKGLIKSLKKKTRTIQKSITKEATDADIKIYKEYQNSYHRLKRCPRLEYYNNKVLQYKNNIKKLWQVINQVINKLQDKTSCINYIMVNNIEYYMTKISNLFGDYFSSVGKILATTIKQSNKSIKMCIEKYQNIRIIQSDTNYNKWNEENH